MECLILTHQTQALYAGLSQDHPIEEVAVVYR
jgi:hypothetical protein